MLELKKHDLQINGLLPFPFLLTQQQVTQLLPGVQMKEATPPVPPHPPHACINVEEIDAILP